MERPIVCLAVIITGTSNGFAITFCMIITSADFYPLHRHLTNSIDIIALPTPYPAHNNSQHIFLGPKPALNDATTYGIPPAMVDQLISVDSDRGPLEPIPVTIMSNGAEAALGSSPAASATRLTSRIVTSAASTNATLIKSSAGYGYIVHGYNNNAAARYLKFYNKATAPTVGTDIPILTFYLTPSDSFAFDLASVRFSAGIGIAITTGAPDADNTAVGGSDIMGLNVVYG